MVSSMRRYSKTSTHVRILLYRAVPYVAFLQAIIQHVTLQHQIVQVGILCRGIVPHEAMAAATETSLAPRHVKYVSATAIHVAIQRTKITRVTIVSTWVKRGKALYMATRHLFGESLLLCLVKLANAQSRIRKAQQSAKQRRQNTSQLS